MSGGPSRCRPLWRSAARPLMLLGIHNSFSSTKGTSYPGGTASHDRVAGVTAAYHPSAHRSHRCKIRHQGRGGNDGRRDGGSRSRHRHGGRGGCGAEGWASTVVAENLGFARVGKVRRKGESGPCRHLPVGRPDFRRPLGRQRGGGRVAVQQDMAPQVGSMILKHGKVKCF
jgi:hypothetical protein